MADVDELRALEAELHAAEVELAESDRQLKREMLKAGFDVAGIADPTPTSDLISAGLSAAEGDVVGVGLSLLSLIPYAGDAVAKSSKAARVTKKINDLKAAVASGMAKVNKLRATREAVQKRVRDAIERARRAPRKKVEPCAPCKPGKGTRLAKIRPWPTPRAKQILKKLEELNKPPPSKWKTQQKRLLSEELGNEAAKQHLRKRLGKDIADKDFQVFEGPHTVNIIYKDPATGKVHVLEAKGGSSQLGTRMGRHPPNKGKTLKQGSPEYLEDVANMMKNSPDPAKRAAGRDILSAKKKGELEYIGVRGGYDPKAPSRNPREPQEVFSR